LRATHADPDFMETKIREIAGDLKIEVIKGEQLK
jgi:hypothetical protein